MKFAKFTILLLILILCFVSVPALADAAEMNPVLGQLALGMSYDDALALDAGLEPAESRNEGEKRLYTEMESWGVLGDLSLDFGTDDALYKYTWSCQIAMPDCTLLDEKYRSDTAQADSEALYPVLCADMLELAGVEADEITPLSYSSDGGQYQMMEWTQETPKRVCVWAANPLHYFFCRFTVSTD